MRRIDYNCGYTGPLLPEQPGEEVPEAGEGVVNRVALLDQAPAGGSQRPVGGGVAEHPQGLAGQPVHVEEVGQEAGLPVPDDLADRGRVGGEAVRAWAADASAVRTQAHAA
jgi:hypothetical protein